MARRKYRTLTYEEEIELVKFAVAHGRRWRRVLSDQWMTASAPPILHALRNSHGPTWLASYRLDKFKLDLHRSVVGWLTTAM